MYFDGGEELSIATTGVSRFATAVLVEEGPQILRTDIPDSVGRLRDGTVRMGYQPLPADYAYIEYVQSRIANRSEGLSFLGHKVDVWC